MSQDTEYIVSPKTGIVLHIIQRYKPSESQRGRDDIVPACHNLQVARIDVDGGVKYSPHKHIMLERGTFGTQECWIVIDGNVKVTYYDTNDEMLCERFLHFGDVSITLSGGHGYEIMDGGAHVIEIKNGPYYGREKDKSAIQPAE